MKTSIRLYKFRILATLIIILFAHGICRAVQAAEHIAYELAVSFDINNNKLFGTAHITIPAGENLSVLRGDLTITAALLQKGPASPGIISSLQSPQITIRRDKVQQELFISYEKTMAGERDNFIEKEGITMLSGWYPYPSKDVRFTLNAILPDGFVAFSESDHLPPSPAASVDFLFSLPRQNLHFIAAPYVVDSLEVRQGLQVYTYFLPEDQMLAREYLEAARGILLRYEDLIGLYPYNHFAIVENLRPTGYGMPTFTLLGKSVIRLPFIKDTSLGHEILHSWFGNSVEVDPSEGNWCEGLTSYLADWLYRQDKGQGAENRKEKILQYQSYVTRDNAIPLSTFQSASHYQPMAKAIRASGYIRGAMFFHELRKYLGDTLFFASIRRFYLQYKGASASWSDMQSIFSEVTDQNLASFFRQRLEQSHIIDLTIENLSADTITETLQLTITQQTEEPFWFMLPIWVKTVNGYEKFAQKINSARQNVMLQLHSAPQELIIDPEYDLLRRLQEREIMMPLSYFLGPAEAKLIIAPEKEEVFSAVVNLAQDKQWDEQPPDKVKDIAIDEHNLVLPGKDNPLNTSLFGLINHSEGGVTLETKVHPLNRSKTILLISASDEKQLQMIMPKLRHYGKYTYLHFRDGRIVDKRITLGEMGIVLPIAAELKGVAAADILKFSDIIDALLESDVVYVGENHTSLGDHELQYRIIETLHRHDKDIAIGLEMFPSSSQQVLDDYTLAENRLSERTFLRQSGYFNVWKYDYRYYKKIIDFAHNKRIPLIGLNIDRDIVSKIFTDGSPGSLSAEEKTLLPGEMDLSLPGYYERLSAIYDVHMEGNHGRGNLSGFIQAQAVWDEVMAENIVGFIKANPQKQVIVLAGTQHTRKDSGIPPRVQRRLNVQQHVLKTHDYQSPADTSQADFYFFSKELSLPAAGKIGISLEEKLKNGDTFLVISALSPQGNGGKSGLKQGDRIVTLNGYAIKTMEDVRIAMVGALPGDLAALTIVRADESPENNTHEYSVELYQPTDPHK